MPATFQVDTGGTLTTSLVAYWNLNEATGTRVDFFSTKNLTLGTEPNAVTGKVGDAADFTAASAEFLTAGNNAAFDNPGDFSISAWLKVTTGTAQAILMKNNDTLLGTGPGWSFNFGVWNPGIFGLAMTKNGTNYLQRSTANATDYSDTTWHFCIVTRSGTTINFYVDNGAVQSVSQGDAGTMDNCSNAVNFNMGRSEDAGGRWYLDGALDEVGFWSKVLSSTERTDLWNGGSGQTMTNAAVSSFLLMGV